MTIWHICIYNFDFDDGDIVEQETMKPHLPDLSNEGKGKMEMGSMRGGGWRRLKSKQWGASEIEINPHSCVSISKFELSKKGG